MAKMENINLGGQEFAVRTKRVYQGELTSDCWSVQVWGLPYCSGFGDYAQMCEFLATDECGGYSVRRKILRGKYPLHGLPDASSGGRP